MTTNTMEKVTMEEVYMLAIKMVGNKVNQIFPNQDENFHNEQIREMLIDEEGTVFILFNDNDEPIMLPMLITEVA